MKVDLHMHSTCSDGERSPEEVIELAANNGLSHISITDHDTVAAYEVAERKAKEAGIQLIPGIEVSALSDHGELHILGYGLDLSNTELKRYSKWRTHGRVHWSKQIVKRLNELSYSIRWEDCMERVVGTGISRTHIAAELVAKGYFRTINEVFSKLLSYGKPAYIERPQLSTKGAIDLIHRCGGYAFIAHPEIYDFSWSFHSLVQEGIDGVEAYYSKNCRETTAYWVKQAQEHRLLTSVGSDFHGETSRNPQMIGSVSYDVADVHQWIGHLQPQQLFVS